MRYKWVLTTILLAAVAHAKEPQRYETGELLQMDSVECGVDENSGKSFAGEVLGTDSAHKKTHALLCQEYLLQTDHVIYRIRPRNLQSAANIRVAPKQRAPCGNGLPKMRISRVHGAPRLRCIVLRLKNLCRRF